MKIIEKEMNKNLSEGDYRFLFENLGELIGKQPEISDYHNIYKTCIDKLLWDRLSVPSQVLTYILPENLPKIETLIYDLDNAAADIYGKFKELNLIYKEYTDKIITTPKIELKEFPKNADDTDKNLLNKIYEERLIYPKIQKSGKYKMYCKDFSRDI